MKLMTTAQIQELKWPQNALQLSLLSITELQTWYLSQDMRRMVFLGQNKEFQRFLFLHYTLPVRLLRLYIKVKRMFIRG